MTKKVNKAALPLFLKGNNDKAVLIIHGYTGFTGDFYDMASQIHNLGFTVSLPRLPGHGTNRKDFKSTGSRDWLMHVEDAYADLEASHKEVYIIGLSMGGILALILSARFNPVRTILLAPAMAMKNKLFYKLPYIHFFLGDVKKEWTPGPGEDSDDIKALAQEYWTADMPDQLVKLRKLQKIAIKELSEISCPLFLMLSEGDNAVSLKAESVIKSGIRENLLTTEILKESHHVLVTGVEKEYVHKRVVEWLEKGK